MPAKRKLGYHNNHANPELDLLGNNIMLGKLHGSPDGPHQVVPAPAQAPAAPPQVKKVRRAKKAKNKAKKARNLVNPVNHLRPQEALPDQKERNHLRALRALRAPPLLQVNLVKKAPESHMEQLKTRSLVTVSINGTLIQVLQALNPMDTAREDHLLQVAAVNPVHLLHPALHQDHHHLLPANQDHHHQVEAVASQDPLQAHQVEAAASPDPLQAHQVEAAASLDLLQVHQVEAAANPDPLQVHQVEAAVNPDHHQYPTVARIKVLKILLVEEVTMDTEKQQLKKELPQPQQPKQPQHLLLLPLPHLLLHHLPDLLAQVDPAHLTNPAPQAALDLAVEVHLEAVHLHLPEVQDQVEVHLEADHLHLPVTPEVPDLVEALLDHLLTNQDLAVLTKSLEEAVHPADHPADNLDHHQAAKEADHLEPTHPLLQAELTTKMDLTILQAKAILNTLTMEDPHLTAHLPDPMEMEEGTHNLQLLPPLMNPKVILDLDLILIHPHPVAALPAPAPALAQV